jgi:hypothetical protein
VVDVPRSDPLVPHPLRLDPTDPRRPEILAAHARAIREGEPRYLDPLSGYWVFTAAFLLDRGTCCESGCRHCPYLGAEAG